MVEMLGVLSVIGVLSLTGLYAYNLAMTRHRTNELLSATSKQFYMQLNKTDQQMVYCQLSRLYPTILIQQMS